MTANIFDIPVISKDYTELTSDIFNNNIRTVTCANTFYLNLAYADNVYSGQLRSFDLIHADGIGVSRAARFLYKNNSGYNKITGSDLYPYLLKFIQENSLRLYILGDSEKVLNKAVQKIRAEYPGIIICGSHNGFCDVDSPEIIKDIHESNPDVIFIGLGSHIQEKWVSDWHNTFSSIKLIAIGGGLRVISGDRHRGPHWIQDAGFEWFVRLIFEPHKYWKRYLIGIPVFIYRVLKQKYK